MPRNYVTVTGNVNIDGSPREKEIQLFDMNAAAPNLVGMGVSDPATGAYSVTALKERNAPLMGVATTRMGGYRDNAKVYAVGDRMMPVAYNGHWYECTVAGSTAASEPTLPTDGTTVVDGTVTWIDKGVIEQPVCRGPFYAADPSADPDVVHLIRFQELVPNDEVTGTGPSLFTYPTMQTAIKKFGTQAPLFNGTSSMYRYAPLAASVFNSNYTIDCWIYVTAVPSSWSRPFFFWGALNTDQFRVQLDHRTDGKVDFYHEYSGAPTYPISTANLPLNQWVLVSGERFNDKQYLYVNGVLAAPSQNTPTSALGLNASHYTYHGTGRASSAQQWFPGYIGEAVVTKRAKYGGQNFTVPTTGFPL